MRTIHLNLAYVLALTISLTGLGCGEEAPVGGQIPDRRVIIDVGNRTPDGGPQEPTDSGESRPDANDDDAGSVTPDTGVVEDGGGTNVDAGPTPTRLDNERRDSDCDGLSDAYEFATVYPGGQKTNP
ncbi:MAG: hypothetical protein VYC39_17740, partial [Myxococcota bacterium]|nr:hypothetical protein [Myxococcota bacterium]